jgi:fatty acid desaturase
MEHPVQRQDFRSNLERLLKSRYAPWITHLGLASLMVLFFALLLLVQFWLAFIPGVVIAHRIGVLVHEYFHGIPFRRYRDNLAVVSFFDGLMLTFGLLEVFRGTHLAHHRWLNTELDPTREAITDPGSNMRDRLAAHPAVQNLIYLRDQLRGERPYVHGRRILLGAILSLTTVVSWWQLGHPEVIWKTLAIIIFTTLVPVSMRGAIEHYSYSGDPNFANEYRVLFPLLNINRHIHHHEQPTVPWYLLKFRTECPLSNWNYFTHWFRVNVKRDFVLMQPMNKMVVKSK